MDRKFCLAIALVYTIICVSLRVRACASKLLESLDEDDIKEQISDLFSREKRPCTDIRKKIIKVSRSPVRFDITYDYGAHPECESDEECFPGMECSEEEGCCT
ncbi:unnamed protein product [Thelazia callipaeda]|uniref:WAP domain-containing protein n=1 Tax=Thelazia callipaeda TaxID=103827 RepID=A0A0N5CSG1_THECL|nr:unnamed protein product [Thelazia callipaeda]